MRGNYITSEIVKGKGLMCIAKECCCEDFAQAIDDKAIEDSSGKFYISNFYFNGYSGRYTRMRINGCPFCRKRLAIDKEA